MSNVMKNDLVKRIIAGATCLAVMAQPVLLAGCKKKDSVSGKPADYGSYGSDIAREIASRFPNRKAYSTGESQTGNYIEEKIKELGYEVEVQTFTGTGGTSKNYIVKVAGTGFYCAKEDGTFVLEHRTAIIGAHYDSALSSEFAGEEETDEEEYEEDYEEDYEEEYDEETEETEETVLTYSHDGLSDNASGTACVLTALMAFKEYKDVAYDVWFVFFGASSDNFAGAAAFYQGLSNDEKNSIDVMYDIDSLYAGDKVYASSGYSSLREGKRYEMRRKLYQAYDVCFGNTLYTSYGFDLYYNESGVKDDVNGDKLRDIFNEMPNKVSDFKIFDDVMIPIVYFESYDYNFTSMDQMKETKNLSLQEYDGIIRGTPADSMALLDSVLIEEDKDRDGNGEVDCTGDKLQIRINCVAFIVLESLLKGSDKGMTPAQYDAYRAEGTKETTVASESVQTSQTELTAYTAQPPATSET